MKRTRTIEWHEGHYTVLFWTTRTRRSRRLRRAWRAARRGDLAAAFELMVRTKVAKWVPVPETAAFTTASR